MKMTREVEEEKFEKRKQKKLKYKTIFSWEIEKDKEYISE